jgi:predicted dehydrogenase
MTDKGPLGLGLIGCGAFGLFCLDAFSRMPEIRVVAAARARKPGARDACRRLGAATFDDPDQVINHAEVDIVHVATPPAFHCETALRALRAGKHVLCEKPPALRVQDAKEMVRAAHDAGRFLATSFVMRYNPVTEAVRRIIDTGVLGQALFARVINCGSDAGLHADHWFWKKELSGGIFIEHGVHFFDLYARWLGPGRVVSAHTESRQGTGLEDRALCTARHDAGAVVTHYHSFDQVAAMDRTAHRIVCEMGDIHVDGWIPMRLTVDAAVDDASGEALSASLARSPIEVIEEYGPEEREILGRGTMRHVTKRIRLEYAPHDDKQAVYAESLRSLLADQIAWARDPVHQRRITEDNGLKALACAETAQREAP